MAEPGDIVRDLAAGHVRAPVLARAFFHIRWTGQVTGGIGFGALIGGVLTLARWKIARWRSKLPSSSYVVVTAEEVFILEFRFAPTQLRREVGRWSRDQITASAKEGRPFELDVTLDGRTVELESSDYTAEAREVGRLLGASYDHPIRAVTGTSAWLVSATSFVDASVADRCIALRWASGVWRPRRPDTVEAIGHDNDGGGNRRNGGRTVL